MRISDWSSDVCSSDLGHVDSVQRGAGQAFAILPSQNATGNFVKVVQRVPVRIVFDTKNAPDPRDYPIGPGMRSEEHTSELQSLMRISYAVFCLKKKKSNQQNKQLNTHSDTQHTQHEKNIDTEYT